MTDYLHISGDTTGHEKFIALGDDDLWRRYDEFDVCHITADGDLMFDIRDMFAPAGFMSGDLLHYWAKLHGFDLHGWDYATLYWKMLQATLFPAVAELPEGEMLMAAHNAVQRGEDVPALPELRIVVNGNFLMEYFVACLEGPFRNDTAFDATLNRRKLRFRPAAKRY